MFLESGGSEAMAGMQEWKGNEKSDPSVFCSEPFGCDLHVALSSLGSPVLRSPVASCTGLVLTDFMLVPDFCASVSPPGKYVHDIALAGCAKQRRLGSAM